MPYNYLIDPRMTSHQAHIQVIRESSDIGLQGNIIVIDEAHNIEDACSSAGSIEITRVELLSMSYL